MQIERLNDLLVSTSEGERVQAQLRAAIAERNLTFLGRPITDVLRPLLIERSLYDDCMAAAHLVGGALRAAGRFLAATPAVQAEHRLEPWEYAALALDPSDPTELVGRLDGFVDAGGVIRFLEYNPVPAGIVDCDELCDVMLEIPALRNVIAAHGGRKIPTRDRMHGAMLAGFSARGGSGAPRIAVLTNSHPDANRGLTLLSLPEFQKILADLQRGGMLHEVFPYDAAAFDGGVLRSPAGTPIDAVAIDEWHSFLHGTTPQHPVRAAVTGGATWLINTLAANVLRGRKSLFALLSSADFLAALPRAEARACRTHVPWTRVVRDTSDIGPSGNPIDLLPFIEDHRSELVLKPANDAGGRNVVLGWTCDPGGWSAALHRAVLEPFVVQARIAPRVERFPVGLDGAIRLEDRQVDLDPFVWHDGAAAGFMTRLSAGGLMNMSAGAGTTAAAFVSAE